jgi:hypothetical protein
LTAEAVPAGPATATGTDPRNVDGQAIAITVFSTVKLLGRVWLPLLFLVARLLPGQLATLRRLSFIHFARWTLVREIPFNGAPQPEVRLKYPHLFFESNFNGGWEEYIDAFAYVLTRGMTFFWGTSYGFPKPVPTGPFKEYIDQNQIAAAHFYSAYPEATNSMVLAALELETELAPLRGRAGTLEPEAFTAEWRRFLTKAQRCL